MVTANFTTALHELFAVAAVELAAPDWWNDYTPDERRKYLTAHPHSRLRSSGVAPLKAALKPHQSKGLDSFVSKLTGPKGKLTAKADAALQLDKIPPAKRKKIAQELRQAHETVGSKQAEAQGTKAIVATLATAGLLFIGGAALVGLGVSLACFTPHLLHGVWESVKPTTKAGRTVDDDHLVTNLCNAIKARLHRGVDAKTIHASLSATKVH